MRHIIFITLCSITTSLSFSMELAQIQPSNSSSEICLFIQNIDHNFTQQYHLPQDIKKKLLTTYIATTHDERIASNKIDTIPLTIYNVNDHRFLRFNCSPIDAKIHYQNLLELPLNMRRTIAHKYSSIILIPTKESWDEKTVEILQDITGGCIAISIVGMLGLILPTTMPFGAIGFYIFQPILGRLYPINKIDKVPFYDRYEYEEWSLLSEEENK